VVKDISVSAVIPAYNEKGAIADVVAGVRDALKRCAKTVEVIVVDDGSVDGTGESAKAAGATVIRHPVNRGYGQALRTGVNAAKGDWVLMTDADGSYPVTEIDKLFDGAPDFDLVIGARTGVHFWGSAWSALLRWIYLAVAGFIVGESIPDANSGLRLVRRSMLMSMGPVECLGFSYSTTMTLSFLQAGRFVKYVPIEFSARVGRSKVRKTRDMLRTLHLMTEVLIVYNPLKLFVVMTAAFLLAAFGFFAMAVVGLGGVWMVAAIIMIPCALACFLTGCLLDALRMHLRTRPS
jgi:glycosyltransferase involved in cell wall biosynthesis